jgi:endonuclease/exonuclease/phosphatase family metal-dependent hydrolase
MEQVIVSALVSRVSYICKGSLSRALIAVALGGLVGAASAFNPAAGDFEKPAANLLRVMSWNVHNNFIYTAADDGRYSRVIKAVKPDVIAFQEMEYSLTATQISDRMETYFPGTTWYVYRGKTDGTVEGVSNRNVIVSKYPLSMTRQDTVPGSAIRGVACALIDLPNATFTKDLYMMDVHFKAGGEISDQNARQKHADAVINWMRDARTAGGNINLPSGTPMLLVGDTNIMKRGEAAPNHPDKTLREGVILDTGTFGPSSKPDWDGSDNGDAAPYDHTNAEPYTHGSGNPDTRIDRFYYTDSVMHAPSKFIVNTQTMSAAARSAAGGLQATDTSGASDHLPCVVDFAMGPATPGKLLVNEFCVNDVGADDMSFIELMNTTGQEINLDAPVDYWIKTSEPLATTAPATENEEFAYDLKGVVPADGGLFVLYDGANESAAIKATVEANLPKLQRQDYTNLLFRNFEYSAFALVGRLWNQGKTIETNVEAYGYAAPVPAGVAAGSAGSGPGF